LRTWAPWCNAANATARPISGPGMNVG